LSGISVAALIEGTALNAPEATYAIGNSANPDQMAPPRLSQLAPPAALFARARDGQRFGLLDGAHVRIT
jgi:hypothetical protein